MSTLTKTPEQWAELEERLDAVQRHGPFVTGQELVAHIHRFFQREREEVARLKVTALRLSRQDESKGWARYNGLGLQFDHEVWRRFSVAPGGNYV